MKTMQTDNNKEGPTGPDLPTWGRETFSSNLRADEEPAYSTHREQLEAATPPFEQKESLLSSMLEQFIDAIVFQEVPFIQFSELTAQELAKAFFNAPAIIKPILSCVNLAQLAIKRDLGIDFDVSANNITLELASIIAGYVKPLLPSVIAIPALMELNRYLWTDKEMRAKNTNWEITVIDAINQISTNLFKKSNFVAEGESFELDTCLLQEVNIEIAVDVKRIESMHGTHKYADEIIDKAKKFKFLFPKGRFYAVVYFPFPTQHINLQSRLKSDHIDEIFFAGETPSSIANTVDMLVGVISSKKKVVGSRKASRVPVGSNVSLVSAKRGPPEKQGLHAWHPYYAGYAENFVRSALTYLNCDNDTLVLDPWGGSGTTAIVSAQQGVSCISLDINPVMGTFSAAKASMVLEHQDAIRTYFQDSLITTSVEIQADSPILRYFSRETAYQIRAFLGGIPFPASMEMFELDELLDAAIPDHSLLINPVYAFCKSVLFVTLRTFVSKMRSSNPTWITDPDEPSTIESEQLKKSLLKTAETMLNDLSEFYKKNNQAISFAVMACDTRKIPLHDSSVDRIITSPPYLTRIDYAVSTSFELSLFGVENLITHVRHSTMGAPVITGKKLKQDEKWGAIVNEFLSGVASHPTKAAKSYYWKNFLQYFSDMDKALDEINRVLRPGGSGLIVVQSSYFKDIEAKLGEMYVEMAEQKGLISRIAFREEVRGHLAHVNTRSSIYKANKVYFEDFVYIEKPSLL